jgi:predicted ABC-type transport system involved in lysophospholipase L1 biosynthesis ATPase subunit
MAEPLLALEAVTLTAPEGRPVFRGLDWRLDRGERFCLRGGCGGGCTALLRLCAGLAEPEAGRVVLDGLPLGRDTAHPFLARGDLGWVPSDGGLAVNLTLLENVALPLRYARLQDRAAAERTALALLDRAGLGARARHRPDVPGDRESWLVSLLRAAARQPRLWLVDRPAGGLDAATLQAAQACLEEAARDPECTLLLVGGEWMAGLGRELQVGNGRVQAGG